MRKFLTTLLAASAMAAPAAALADEPGPDGPRGRTHVGQRDNDNDSNSEGSRGSRAGERARPSGGERAESDRPRFERPATVERPSAPDRVRPDRASTVDRADRPDRGPPEWKMDRPATSEASTMDPPRVREQGRPAGARTDRPTPRTRDGWTPRPDTAIPGRDRPDGSFNRPPSSTTSRHTDYRQWNRTWRDDRKYDWRHYRDRNRSLFRLGFYYDPYGYQYRRWNIGWAMRPYYYRSTFWIDDPWRYRLPDVYGPYRWVRYYDDAILVNTWTGEVVDVIYNFFW